MMDDPNWVFTDRQFIALYDYKCDASVAARTAV